MDRRPGACPAGLPAPAAARHTVCPRGARRRRAIAAPWHGRLPAMQVKRVVPRQPTFEPQRCARVSPCSHAVEDQFDEEAVVLVGTRAPEAPLLGEGEGTLASG